MNCKIWQVNKSSHFVYCCEPFNCLFAAQDNVLGTGTTALVCLLRNNAELFVGHVGDSKALMCRSVLQCRLIALSAPFSTKISGPVGKLCLSLEAKKLEGKENFMSVQIVNSTEAMTKRVVVPPNNPC